MAIIVWSASFSVDHPDSLHRQLLARELVLDSSILATIRHKFFNHVLMEDKEIFRGLTAQVRCQS